MVKKLKNKTAIEESFDVLSPSKQLAPIVFASPHSGTAYPTDFIANSPLNLLALRRSEDSYVDQLFSSAPEHGFPLLRALFPRAFLDPNREPFELDPSMFQDTLPEYVNTGSMRVTAGLGTIPRVVSSGKKIYSNQLQFSEAAQRIDNIYRPYHKMLKKLLENTRQTFGCYVLIDCHSMPSVGGAHDPDAGRQRPDIVLGNCFATACNEYVINFVEKIFEGFGYKVSRNKPFAGGFTTHHYGSPRSGLHALQIEINRALYMDEKLIKPNEGMKKLNNDISEMIKSLSKIETESLYPERNTS